MWLSTNLAFDAFDVVITWTRDYSGKCADKHEDSDIKLNSSANYTIEGLEENSTYTIDVEIVGLANVSAAVMTKAAGKQYNSQVFR